MRKDSYIKLIWNMLSAMMPYNAIFAIFTLNSKLVKEQPHLQRLIYAVEYVISKNYIPFTVHKKKFPVSPPGQEYTEEYAQPAVSPGRKHREEEDERVSWQPCSQSYWSRDLFAELTVNKSFEDQDGDNVLEKIRLSDLLEADTRSLVENIDIITKVGNPCCLCSRIKMFNPDLLVRCSGHRELCQFKYDMLESWPSELGTPNLCSYSVVSCNSRFRYFCLMDHVFRLKYFERSMVLKAKIDEEIVKASPHMAQVCALYDLVLYRFFGSKAFCTPTLPFVPCVKPYGTPYERPPTEGNESCDKKEQPGEEKNTKGEDEAGDTEEKLKGEEKVDVIEITSDEGGDSATPMDMEIQRE